MRSVTGVVLLGVLASSAAFAQPAAPAKTPGPSSILQGALKLYESGDYHAASRELHRAAEGEGQDSTANRQRADFFLLKALHHLGFHSVALGLARKIQQQGSANPYRDASLKWVLVLSRKLPDALGAAPLASRHDRAALTSPILDQERWEATLLVARGLAQMGKESDTIDLLRRVPATASARAKARLLLGILLGRGNELGRAQAALGEALSLLEKNPTPAARGTRELALLHLARASWAAGAHETSLKHYARLQTGSPFGPELTLLRGVRALELGDPRRATEELHRLHGLRFSHAFFPEGLVLRAAVYLREGQLDRSQEALKSFARSFGKLGDQLVPLATREKDPGEVLGHLRRDLKDGSRDAEERRAIAAGLDDLGVEASARAVDLLDSELALVQRSPADWKCRAIAGVVLQELTLQRSLLVNQTGSLIQRRMRSLGQRIGALAAEAQRVQRAIARCRAMKQRSSVTVSLQPRLAILFQPREGSAERHDLFTLKLELGGCGRAD